MSQNEPDPKPDDVEIPEDAEWENLSPYQRYYYKNREAEKERTAERQRSLYDWYHEMKREYGCSLCDESHPACIDFHHEDGEKDMGVAEMVNNGYSRSRIKEEMEKCTPLCANCHRKLHSDFD